MHLLNCTPHPVRIYSPDGKDLLWELPPETYTVRVTTPPQKSSGAMEVGPDTGDLVPPGWDRAYSGNLFGVDNPGKVVIIPLVTPQDFSGGTVTGLPEWARDGHEDGYPYSIIVSVVGAEQVARAWNGGGRMTFVTDTGPDSVVRDARGNILGVRRLIVMP